MRIENVSLWNQAVVLFSEGKFDDALTCLEKITEQTAKILFDVGCVHLCQGSPNKALESFAKTIQKDEHLSVGHFQHGVAAFKVNRISSALDSFQKACFYMRGHAVIDYRQLGLNVKLYATQVLLNLALCFCRKQDKTKALKWLKDADSLDSTPGLKSEVSSALIAVQNDKEYRIQELSSSAIFRPSKATVDNLKQRNFLGEAKVVAALDQSDTFTGFAGPRKRSSGSSSSSAFSPKFASPKQQLSRQNSHSLEDLSRLRAGDRLSPAVSPTSRPNSPRSPNHRPPPPNAPPPRLPHRKMVLVQQNSLSMEDLLSDGSHPLPKLTTSRNRKTDQVNRPMKCISTPLSPVAEDREMTTCNHGNRSRGIPREAPKRPPPVPCFSGEQSLKCQPDQRRIGPLERVPQRASNILQMNNQSLVMNNLKVVQKEDIRIRNFGPPPSRPPPRPPPDKPTPTPVRSTVAVYSYDPGAGGQLMFKEGEIITVEEDVDENWFQGRLRGKSGLVPWTYVQSMQRKSDIFH